MFLLRNVCRSALWANAKIKSGIGPYLTLASWRLATTLYLAFDQFDQWPDGASLALDTFAEVE